MINNHDNSLQSVYDYSELRYNKQLGKYPGEMPT